MTRDANTSPTGGAAVALSYIGRNIRNLRRSQNLTQAELGARLQRRKLSRQAIAGIESGGNTDLETLADIATALATDLPSIMTDATDPEATRFAEKLHASTRTSDFFRALADMVDQLDRRGKSE